MEDQDLVIFQCKRNKLYGRTGDRYRICEYDNINNAEIFYFTDYGVNPSPKQKFDAFKNYYLKTND